MLVVKWREIDYWSCCSRLIVWYDDDCPPGQGREEGEEYSVLEGVLGELKAVGQGFNESKGC